MQFYWSGFQREGDWHLLPVTLPKGSTGRVWKMVIYALDGSNQLRSEPNLCRALNASVHKDLNELWQSAHFHWGEVFITWTHNCQQKRHGATLRCGRWRLFPLFLGGLSSSLSSLATGMLICTHFYSVLTDWSQPEQQARGGKCLRGNCWLRTGRPAAAISSTASTFL